jgi:hypothetical protein
MIVKNVCLIFYEYLCTYIRASGFWIFFYIVDYKLSNIYTLKITSPNQCKFGILTPAPVPVETLFLTKLNGYGVYVAGHKYYETRTKAGKKVMVCLSKVPACFASGLWDTKNATFSPDIDPNQTHKDTPLVSLNYYIVSEYEK